MHPVAVPLLVAAMLWVGWLLWDGLRTGEVWVKGGAADRLTRPLDMESFAHKVGRDESPWVYWLNMALFAAVELMGLYLLFRH